ncbi:unnamed protein product [Pleuronectes platessa]|uniref:Uncharacterized protein n=1 Tax=Pleuronectes platessa TaxID=8262 RepID=A0A9N7Z858_PLEPL|nr:unnamed protein product [Pleuronectes platessa]
MVNKSSRNKQSVLIVSESPAKLRSPSKEVTAEGEMSAADTLNDIDTVRGFCEDVSKWGLRRETELNMMKDIKERVDKSGSHATLQEELDAVLKDTLVGLAKLECFLDAVEKLAVTSLLVFTENQFKRDAKVFFLPRLQNVEVLSYELDKYIRTTQTICETFGKSSVNAVTRNNASGHSSSLFTSFISTSDPDNDYRTQEVDQHSRDRSNPAARRCRLRRLTDELPRGGDFMAQIQHRGIMPAPGGLLSAP